MSKPRLNIDALTPEQIAAVSAMLQAAPPAEETPIPDATPSVASLLTRKRSAKGKRSDSVVTTKVEAEYDAPVRWRIITGTTDGVAWKSPKALLLDQAGEAIPFASVNLDALAKADRSADMVRKARYGDALA